jgi:hypothetical protein
MHGGGRRLFFAGPKRVALEYLGGPVVARLVPLVPSGFPGLLPSRPSFAGAPAVESPAGAGSAGISDVARLEIHTQAAL